MLRIKQIFALGLLLTLTGPAYAKPTQHIHPQPSSPHLIALEDALAGPDLVGLFYLDMNYLLRLEKRFHGEGDALALPTNSNKNGKMSSSFLTFLGQSGLRVNESVDYILGGLYAREKDAGKVLVTLGDFPVNTLTRNWQKNKDVQQTEINGRTAWLWSPVDIDTCKPSHPQVLVAEKDRLIAGDPETVGWFLNRTDSVKAQQDLSYWRNYRSKKLFSFSVFLPRNLNSIPQNKFIQMLTQSLGDKALPVTGVYGGGTVTRNPNGIDLEILLESRDTAWNRQRHNELQQWKKKTLKEIAKDFKSVKNLLNYLNSRATEEQLVLQVKINEVLLKDIGGVFQEGVQWFSSSLSSSLSKSNEIGKSSEKILPMKEINHYRHIPKPEDMDPFDASANADEIFAGTTGPFGVRIKGISINPDKTGDVDLDLEIMSSPIPKLNINPWNPTRQGMGAWFQVTHVYGKNGKELLKDEPCGKDRNSKSITLQKGYRNIDSKRARKTPTISKLFQKNPRFSNITLDVLKGSKTVHLQSGTRLSDIATIEGEVILQLPSNISKKRISAPFTGQVVQTNDFRIKMKPAAADSISFTASGKVDHLLETRALNRSGKYLQNNGTLSSALFFGTGINKNYQFHGTPSSVEFVFAREMLEQVYPFKVKFRRPAYPASPFFNPVAVQTQSRRVFLSQRLPTPKRAVCSNKDIEFQSRPFYICLNPNMHIRNTWQQTGKFASGSFLIHTQDSSALTDNLSGAQMVVEKVIVQDGNEMDRRSIDVTGERYVLFDSNYVSPLKGDQFRIEAGPVEEEGEHLTPVGFKGYLKIRLPRKLDSFRLDLYSLGSTARSSNGLEAQFTGISEKGVQMKLKGPRDTLVHFIPLNPLGKPLNQKKPHLESLASEDTPSWQAEVQVPPETRYMDIVFAPNQDTWKIPFHIEK